jgi:hypothetical protein
MKKVMAMLVGVVLVSAVAAYANCGSCPGDKPVSGCAGKAVCKATEVYVCTMCKTGSKEAGKCVKCGMKLVGMHVLACNDGMVSLCSCEAGCKCAMAEDGAKCGCGKDVVKIPMKTIPGCGACKKPAPKGK